MSLIGSFAILAVGARWIFHPIERLVFPLLCSCNVCLLVVTGIFNNIWSIKLRKSGYSILKLQETLSKYERSNDGSAPQIFSLSTDELLQQKMEEIEERMKQRKLEKFEEHKGTMQQQIAINIIARLQRLNPDLQLNPDLLAFCARSCSSEQTEGGENEEANEENIEEH
ncbi:hypothetical protein P3S68_021842 [Capsicum galapagoense]